MQPASPTTYLGVLAQPWRAGAHADGSLVAPDGGAVRWAIVAEDRVHAPETSPSLRQHCVDGAPVVETALRVPGGDVAVTAYGVADGRGALVVEVDNRAGAAVAFACSRTDAVTARPFTAPPAGSGLADGWGVLALAHGASLRLALPVADVPAQPGIDVSALPSAAAVVRGWCTQLAGGLHGDLPADIDERVRRSRAHACLAPYGDPLRAPVESLLRAAQLASIGLAHDVEVESVAAAVERLASSLRRAASTPWDASAAFVGAATALDATGDARARRDLDAVVARLPAADEPPDEPPDDPARYEAWITSRLAVAVGDSVRVLPHFPPAWLGVNVAAYAVPTLAGPVGIAVRWHGERPALLWQVPRGATVTCPGLDPTWSSREPSGEALLGAPRPLAS